jgi:hypothetical protein
MPSSTLVEPVASGETGLEIEAHFERILQSSQFTRAETLRKLLLYLWAHRDATITEYAIATEALGRRADFDPKTDASVRVQISRLRRKLKDYYEQAPFEPEILQIPTGTHQIVMTESAQTLPLLAPRTLSLNSLLLPVLGGLCIALLVLSGWLIWQKQQYSKQFTRIARPNSFWTSFIGGDAPVKILLPTPVFFSFNGARNIRVRAVDVNDFNERGNSPEFKELTAGLGQPSLEHSYTVTSDTLAAIDLARYLDTVGLGKSVSFNVTNDSPMQVLEQANVVAFGAHATLRPFQDYLASMNFSLAYSEAWVDNAHPAPSEQARYSVNTLGSGRQIEPSILAVLPGRAPGLKLLILQSRHTSALVSLVTSHIGDSLIEKMLQAHGNPRFFEMVIFTESEGDHILRSWPAAMHPYTREAPSGADVTQ